MKTRSNVVGFSVILITLGLICVIPYSCQTHFETQAFEFDLPKHFPAVPIPEDNPMTLAKIELGEKLFFDPNLSSDSTISCASCHLPQFAFSDTSALSRGVDDALGFRNTPTLANVGYNEFYFHDGGAETLELQLNVPFTDHAEMNMSYRELADRIASDKEYIKLFNQVFDKDPDLFGLTRALAAYERTLISANSRFDQYMEGDSNAITLDEIAGMDLFYSERFQCGTCHSGFNFTNNGFENIGLYELYEDYGHMRISTREKDRGKFKVPTLRNIELTAPYMHDGSIETLEEVIDHFIEGGKNNPRKSTLLKPADISHREKENLMAFLKTLTDKQFISQY